MAPEPLPRSMFLIQPLTGRLYRVEPGPARAYRFEFGDKRRWLELTLPRFAQEVAERTCVSLRDAPSLALTGDWRGDVVEMDYGTHCALDDGEEEDEDA